MTSGLVVAGGYSTRFGVVEKPLAEVDGVPMLRRSAGALAPLVDDLVVCCRIEQVEPFRRALGDVPQEPRFVVDPEPDCGPVAGLERGVATVRERGDPGDLLVLSCDRPGVTSDALRALQSRRVGADVAAAVPTVDAQIQPLCGSYRTRALHGACQAVLNRGPPRLTRVPHRLCHLAVPGDDLCDASGERAFRSVDTALEAAVQPVGPDRTDDGAGRAVDVSDQVARRASERV